MPVASETISGIPPTAVAITGIPQLSASMIETGMPSDSLTFMKTSMGLCR